MWTFDLEQVEAGRVTKYWLRENESFVPYRAVIEHWQKSADFREQFTTVLKDSPFAAYRWETPSLTKSNLDRDFEFVLINSPALDRPVDEQSFADHFSEATPAKVMKFNNLSGDATMVVPRPLAEKNCYGHLAAFVRLAPSEQVHELWNCVGAAMNDRVGDKPVWLSTAGMGVSWLHIRLDSRPKYYGHQPYRSG